MKYFISTLLAVSFITCLPIATAQAQIGRGPDLTVGYLGTDLTAQVPTNVVTQPVFVPTSSYQRPQRLYVLPVLLAPAGQGEWLPDRSTPGLNLDGDVFTGTPRTYDDDYPTLYARAANNLSAHLQSARLMYKHVMRNPLNGKPRGTFELATWDANAGLARKVISPTQVVQPLVMELQNYDRAAITALTQVTPNSTPYYVEEILDKLGCKRMSCPFLLVIAIAGDPIGQAHGIKWNYGYNNGGGAVYMDYSKAINSWSTQPSDGHNFLSTIVHELGHAFGMPHTEDYCSYPDCRDLPYLSDSSGMSIMSNNTANWIFGCQRTSPLDPTHCLVPGARTVALLPGVFVREDKRLLNANKLAFPDFGYLPALDHPNPTDSVRRLDAGGDHDITTTGRFHVESNDSGGWRPSAIIGGFSERFAHIMETDRIYTWSTKAGASGSWAEYHIRFPESIFLERMRVYGGRSGGNNGPAGLQLFVEGDPNPIATGYSLYGANYDLNTGRSGKHFILQVQRGASGVVDLRGLRFFGKRPFGTVTEEFYPAAEPVATTPFGSDFGGSINNIVGSDQLIADSDAAFQPSASWHSSRRDPGSWVSVDVEFPEATDLTGILVYNGHTDGVHGASQIQIERQCVCRYPHTGQGGTCKLQTLPQCSAAGGEGEQVYEVVSFEPSAWINSFVGFPQTTAKNWRVALRTLSGQGPDSWMVVRGLRFWGEGGVPSSNELFPPRGTVP